MIYDWVLAYAYDYDGVWFTDRRKVNRCSDGCYVSLHPDLGPHSLCVLATVRPTAGTEGSSSTLWVPVVCASAHNSHLGRHFPRLRQHTTVAARATERAWLKSRDNGGRETVVAFSISAAVSWGDQVCAVKRLNYPRISGIQTEAPRRGPSTGDQRALRGVRWTGGEVEYIGEYECV